MLRLTDFRINTSYLANIRSVNGIYVNSEVKVKINNVAISKFMVIREDILNILHVRKHYFVITRRITGYLSRKISV